jgi:hypothetical protein
MLKRKKYPGPVRGLAMTPGWAVKGEGKKLFNFLTMTTPFTFPII